MLADSLVLAFTPNKKCTRTYTNKDGDEILCPNKLNSIPAKFGSERYCSNCIRRDIIAEQLHKEKGNPCKSPNCNSYAKKQTDDQPLAYGEDVYCYICFHTLKTQKDLILKRQSDKNETPCVPFVLREPRNWLNISVFTNYDIQRILNIKNTTRYTIDLVDLIPNHLRYICEVFLNGIPEYEAKILIWINEVSPNKMKLVVKESPILKSQFMIIYYNAMNELIKKIKWILFRQQENNFEYCRKKLLRQLRDRKKSYLAEDTFNAIIIKLEDNPDEESGDYIKEFIKEEINFTEEDRDRLAASDIYNRYALWLEKKGLKNKYGSVQNMGKDLIKHTNRWEEKHINGIRYYCGVKFNE